MRIGCRAAEGREWWVGWVAGAETEGFRDGERARLVADEDGVGGRCGRGVVHGLGWDAVWRCEYFVAEWES